MLVFKTRACCILVAGKNFIRGKNVILGETPGNNSATRTKFNTQIGVCKSSLLGFTHTNPHANCRSCCWVIAPRRSTTQLGYGYPKMMIIPPAYVVRKPYLRQYLDTVSRIETNDTGYESLLKQLSYAFKTVTIRVIDAE